MSTENSSFAVEYWSKPSRAPGELFAGVVLVLCAIGFFSFTSGTIKYLSGGAFFIAGAINLYIHFNRKKQTERLQGTLWNENGAIMLKGPDPLQEQEAERKMRLEKPEIQSQDEEGIRVKGNAKGAFDSMTGIAPLFIRYATGKEEDRKVFVQALEDTGSS